MCFGTDKFHYFHIEVMFDNWKLVSVPGISAYVGADSAFHS